MAFLSRFKAVVTDAVAAASSDVDGVRRSDGDVLKPGCGRPSTDEFRTLEVAARKGKWHPVYVENEAARSGNAMLSNYVHQ